ncbi:molybdopterin-dependent oxidoreductase [Shewanella maritima]|uniref:nitrate reductase n=1 Tax=Shewanella maritima TaxID=2520507 RepID=UPI0037351371
MASVETSCAYCGVGCGITIDTNSAKQTQLSTNIDGLGGAQPQFFGLTGTQQHPSNFGHLCAKGESLLQTLVTPNVLRFPRLASGKPISWEDAISTISQRFQAFINQYGSDSVAIYLSGQLLTEDYYVANKFAKGFLKTANVDTNSRLCMSSAVSAHLRAFGEDVVAGCYQDLELADVVVLVGSNAAWTHPVLFQRLLAARSKRGTKIVVIDPMLTATAKQADLHLAINPGADLDLFNHLLLHIEQTGQSDTNYIQSNTQGFTRVIEQLKLQYHSDNLGESSGISTEKLTAFFELFCSSQRVVTASCQGVNQSITGTSTTNAIINCHLARGQVGQVGSGFLSLTGQPNAMGGREVGGLATQLASHMGFSKSETQLLADFWQTDSVANHKGLTAVDMFDAVANGKIKAIWILGTNPVASLPDSHKVKQALNDCPFVVVSDITADSDTAKTADILLPALGWSQKDGTVTNSERTISRQRQFNHVSGDAKPDWWAIAQVAQHMGFNGFEFQNSYQVFNEHAQLSARVKSTFPNIQFDLTGLENITEQEYDQLLPTQWPINDVSQIGQQSTRIYTNGKFSTVTDKAQFINTVTVERELDKPSLPLGLQNLSTQEIILNSGRSRDQWHTMTRTGHVAKLRAHQPEPYLYLSAETMANTGLYENQLIRCQQTDSVINQTSIQTTRQTVENASSDLTTGFVARVKMDSHLKLGHGWSNMHWSEQFSPNAGVNKSISSITDPLSMQPAFKNQKVSLYDANINLQGMIFGDCEPQFIPAYWVQHALTDGLCRHVGFAENQSSQLNGKGQQLSWTYDLESGQRIDISCLIDTKRLSSLQILSKQSVKVALEAVNQLIGQTFDSQLLKTLQQLLNAGDSPLVCACTGVTEKQIIQSLQHNLTSELVKQAHEQPTLGQVQDAMQQQLGCGRQCGSCQSEVSQCSQDNWQQLLSEARHQQNKPGSEDVA